MHNVKHSPTGIHSFAPRARRLTRSRSLLSDEENGSSAMGALLGPTPPDLFDDFSVLSVGLTFPSATRWLFETCRPRSSRGKLSDGMRGGRREGAGRPPGSGNGPTVEVRSVSMIPQAWQLLDQMRGASSRGVWIAASVFRAHNGHAAELSKASLTPPPH